MSDLKPHQRGLVLAIFVTVAVVFLPYVRLLMLPLEYLDTHFHELGHAVMGKLAGDDVGNIYVYWAGNGETQIGSSHPILVGSAGYLGAMLIGALTILWARSERGAVTVLRFLALLLLLSMVFFVRGDTVGIVTGIAWVIGLWGLSFLRSGSVLFAAQFVGIQQCLHALQAVFYVVRLGTTTHSDATIVESATGIPATLWALLWAGLSLTVGYTCLRTAWRTVDTPLPLA